MPIRQEISIRCGREKLHRTLTDSTEFAAATGAPAEIDAAEGGAFSGFDGQVTGRNIEISEGRIVQAWRVGPWPEGVYSIVRFDLEEDGAGTRLTLSHDGYPEGAEEHLTGGWHAMYWEPIKAYCE